MRRLILFVLGLVAALVPVPTTAVADSTTHTYLVVMEVPNIGVAANGDRISITGEGEFSVHPKSVEAEGAFTHTTATGTVVASGTWEATVLLEYQSYGCGELFGDPSLPDNFCGGVVKMRVTLMPAGTSLHLRGILTVICVIGPNPPNSINGPRGEGVTLDVPGIANFNHSAGGENIYIQTS
jgi:hypothetical protein